ncbi:ferritin heavy chain-like [Spodoptera litura]|uniref:Ferritin n=1 Tax=Spodoptera litura TaxID=69820 RepID=A0A9J7EF08_SPOLT|nr:ferritin heavy chain-like [Spodoptera litura]
MYFKWRYYALVKLGLKEQVHSKPAHNRRYYSQNNSNSRIEELINIQIKAEQQASQNYLNIAVTFLHPSKSLLGVGGFFMKMYNDELEHMHKLINYQLLRGGSPLISGLEPPNQHKNLTILDAFKEGLCMEKNITELIEKGIKLAEEVKDFHYVDFITSVFLTEQFQSIHEFDQHVTKLTTLKNNDAFYYLYDMELQKNYPLSHNIKNLFK